LIALALVVFGCINIIAKVEPEFSSGVINIDALLDCIEEVEAEAECELVHLIIFKRERNI
jgi:hypothetical protein